MLQLATTKAGNVQQQELFTHRRRREKLILLIYAQKPQPQKLSYIVGWYYDGIENEQEE